MASPSFDHNAASAFVRVMRPGESFIGPAESLLSIGTGLVEVDGDRMCRSELRPLTFDLKPHEGGHHRDGSSGSLGRMRLPFVKRTSKVSSVEPKRDPDLLRQTYSDWYGSHEFAGGRSEQLDEVNAVLLQGMTALLSNFDTERYAGALKSNVIVDTMIIDQLRSGKLPILIGLSDRRGVNTFTQQVPGGLLITMTEGFVWLTIRLCYLLSASSTFVIGERNIQPTLSEELAAKYFRSAIRDAEAGQLHEHWGKWQDRLDSLKMQQFAHVAALQLNDSLLEYAIAHELGHIALGHIDLQRSAQAVPESPQHRYPQSQELTADHVATQFVSDLHPELTEERYFGAIAYFELIDAVDMERLRRDYTSLQWTRRNFRNLSEFPHPAYRRHASMMARLHDLLNVDDAGLPASDALAMGLWSLGGHPKPQRNEQDLREIFRFRESSNTRIREDIINAFHIDTQGGVWQGGDGDWWENEDTITRLIEESQELAIGAVATAAALYLGTLVGRVWVVSLRSQRALATLFERFQERYMENVAKLHPNVDEFKRTLYGAIPEIDYIRSVLYQTGRTD